MSAFACTDLAHLRAHAGAERQFTWFDVHQCSEKALAHMLLSPVRYYQLFNP